MQDGKIAMLLWVFPITLGLHVFEEFAFPGGFSRWIAAFSPRKPKSDFYYFLVNALGIVAAIIIALKAKGTLGFRLYLYAVAIMAGNAATHIRGTIRQKQYCPGTISSALLLLPLFGISHLFFVSNGLIDLPSTLAGVCAGMVVGFYALGVDVKLTTPIRIALVVCLPVTLLLFLLLPAPANGRSTGIIDVYDGFETPGLSKVWDTDRFERGAVEMQTNIVRAGHGAAKIVVRSKDKFEAGINGSSDTERAELLEASSLLSQQNETYEFSFSMFFPTNFPITPTRLVIAQWKQQCPSGGNCSDDSPVLAVRYISGELRITQDLDKKRTTLYHEQNEFRGRWLDFKFQVRFATSENGCVKAWLGDRQLVDYQGVTADSENATTGYPNPSRFYFKMGLYRNVMPEPWTSYIDEYRKKQLPDAGH